MCDWNSNAYTYNRDKNRSLGLNMWKLKTKLQLIDSIGTLFIVVWHLEQKDGLPLFRGCVKDLLA